MKQVAKLLGEHIRILRRRGSLSLESLAERAQLSATYVGEVERGTKEPSISTLVKLSEALGVKLQELLEPIIRKAGERIPKYEVLGEIEIVMQESYPPEQVQAILSFIRALSADYGPGGHSVAADAANA